MAVNIHNLIAAISPEIYCDPSSKSEVKKILSEGKEGKDSRMYIKASEKAKPASYEFMDLIDIQYKNASAKPGLKAPIEKHLLMYDSFGESLEPIYFWILDKMNDEFKKVDKLIDTFASSPGSGHFSELGLKASSMQQQASKLLGDTNTVIKSILNIIYDLKEFNLRLDLYDRYHSENEIEKHSAILSLKQVWLDTVDVKRNVSSMYGLAQRYDYVTLIDAFMAADIEKNNFLEKLDLNERVKRILEQRVMEFTTWIKESEEELRKRREIEKTYLKSQINSVKLYSRWIKPYLKAARSLEQSQNPSAALVTSFNTSLMELVLLGETEYSPEDDIKKGDLPKLFTKIKTEKKFFPILVVEFKFRSAPERAGQQGYGFRGRTDVTFTSYALSNEELAILRREMGRDDFEDVFKFIEGATDESLATLNLDIEKFLGDEEEKKEDSKSEDTNPFSSLFSFSWKSEKEAKKDSKEKDELTPDSEYEKILRSQAVIEARKKCYRVYDLYKKAHRMPSLPGYS